MNLLVDKTTRLYKTEIQTNHTTLRIALIKGDKL
jgi:hypothetical protein